MPKLGAHEAFIFIVQLLILLGSAKLLGEIFKKIKQPAVIGELLAGIILGPTILGAFWPHAFDWLFRGAGGASIALDGLVTFGVIFLLLIVGLEIDLDSIAKQKKAVTWIGVLGIIIPLVMGFGMDPLFQTTTLLSK